MVSNRTRLDRLVKVPSSLDAGLHLVSRCLKAEEHTDAGCGAARVARRQRCRQKTERKRSADSGLHSPHRAQVSNVAELHFADREDRRGVLVRVQVMRRHSSNFPSTE